MARPAVIQDSAILDAAREVFLSRGIRATTAEVAARAGVSEGSIFKRYRSKSELFQAAMGSLDSLPPFVAELETRVGQGDVRDGLRRLGHDLTAHLRRVVPLHLMAWSNPGPDGTPSFLSCSHPAPLRTLQAISSYFEAEMLRGRLAEHDPEIAARAFVGSVHNYVILDLLFGAHNEQRIPEESFLRRLVDLLWSGLDPTNGESPQSSGGRP